MQVESYRLGEGYATTVEGKPLYSLPYTIHYTPGFAGGAFFLASGDARNGNGTFLSAAQVLSSQWRTDLLAARGEWLLPLLERMAGGENVSSSEVLAAYQKVHGKRPPREEWKLRE